MDGKTTDISDISERPRPQTIIVYLQSTMRPLYDLLSDRQPRQLYSVRYLRPRAHTCVTHERDPQD